MALDSAHIRGADHVLAMLRSLPDDVLKKGGGAVRAGLRDGLKVIQSAAVANLDAIIAEPNIGGGDNSTGLLRDNVVLRRAKMPAGVKGEAYRLRISSKKYPGEKGVTTTQVGRQLETGTELRTAMPWMRPAYEMHKEEAAQVAVDRIGARLDAILKKLSA